MSLSCKTFWILQILPERKILSSLSSPVAYFLNLFIFFSYENYACSTILLKVLNILSSFFVSFKALIFWNLTISVLLSLGLRFPCTFAFIRVVF